MTTQSNYVFTISEMSSAIASFEKPEKFSGFHKSCIVLNGSHRGFILQTPKIVLRDSNTNYFDLLLSQNKDRQKDFYNIIAHLEDSAMLQISQNSKEWFGKEIPKNQVEAMFKSSINRPLEMGDPFVFRVNKNVNINIEPNYPVVCLIKIDGIIFGRNSSSLDMKVIQVKVFKDQKIRGDIDDVLDNTQKSKPENPFYNDNISVAPSQFMENKYQESKKEVVENDFKEINLEEKIFQGTENSEEKSNIENDFKEIDLNGKTSETLEETKDVIEHVQDSIQDSIQNPVQNPVQDSIQNPVQNESCRVESGECKNNTNICKTQYSSKEALKCELMKAIIDNDFQKLQDLSVLLKEI